MRSAKRTAGRGEGGGAAPFATIEFTETMDRETAEEIRRHFNVVGESLRTEIRAVAEGLVGLRETTTAEFRAVREEIADTRAMLRLSFADLERRIRSGGAP
jgi:hypothetical protein